MTEGAVIITLIIEAAQSVKVVLRLLSVMYIRNLKIDKSDGEPSFYTDHIINAPHRIYVILAQIFKCNACTWKVSNVYVDRHNDCYT